MAVKYEVDGRKTITKTEAARVLGVSKNAVTEFAKDGRLTNLLPDHGTRRVWEDEVLALSGVRQGGITSKNDGRSAGDAARLAGNQLQRQIANVQKYHVKLVKLVDPLIVAEDALLTARQIGDLITAEIQAWMPDFASHLTTLGEGFWQKEKDHLVAEIQRCLADVTPAPAEPISDDVRALLVVKEPRQNQKKLVIAKADLEEIKVRITRAEVAVHNGQLVKATEVGLKVEGASTTLGSQVRNVNARILPHVTAAHRRDVKAQLSAFVLHLIERVESLRSGRGIEDTALDQFLRGLIPPEELTGSEWAEKYRVLTSEASAEPGRWSNARTPYLIEPMDSMCGIDPDVRKVSLMFGAQLGKALALDTKIPTPPGWREMGDLRPGDQVFDELGQPCRVVDVSQRWNDRPCYEITFHDGTSIIADENHEWPVVCGAGYRIMDTWAIAESQVPVSIPDFQNPNSDGHGITSIKRVKNQPTVCIEVSSPSHLFLAGEGMIPTHNSECLLNSLGYVIDQTPSPILVVQPSDNMAAEFARSRVSGLMRTPQIEAKVEEVNEKVGKKGGAVQTALSRSFPGGTLSLVSAGSPANLASRPVRFLLMDEVDRYAITKEGSAVALAERRTASFSTNKMIVQTSTPTRKETSVIARSFEAGDQRHYYVKCPHCEHRQILDFDQIVCGEDDDPSIALYQCTSDTCGSLWDDADRSLAVSDGVWIAHRPEVTNHRSYHLNSLASPFYSLEEIVVEMREAKRSDETWMTFVNTMMAAAYSDADSEIEEDVLIQRMAGSQISLENIPEEVLLLTAGVDVQANRLEAQVLGHSATGQVYALGHVVFPGDPSGGSVWAHLDDFLMTKFRHPYGGDLTVSAVAVDSGYLTDTVTAFCAKRASRYFAIKGVAGDRSIWQRSKAKPKFGHAHLHLVGVDQAKTLVMSMLNKADPALEGYVHFADMAVESPAGAETYAEQLLAEYRHVTFPKGAPKVEWRRKSRGRNAEVLDTFVYAMAAKRGLPPPDWDRRKDNLVVNPDYKPASTNKVSAFADLGASFN